MKLLNDFVTGFSKQLDRIAGLCIFCTMAVVVANILLRAIFNQPIIGTYEIVCYITALAIALSLANCAIQSGHIAVGIIVDRFPLRLQAIIDFSTNLIALGFWGLSVWYLGDYANTTAMNGLVSPTAQIPIAPIIYLVALGLVGLCLVILVRTVDSLIKILADIPLFRFTDQSESISSVRKAIP